MSDVAVSDARDLNPARTLLMHEDDNVVLALDAISDGEAFGTQAGLVARGSVSCGHKIARCAIAPGEAVIKYGQVIGIATTLIQPGDHVHVHNVSAAAIAAPERARRVEPSVPVANKGAEFEGYRRPDGRVGTRNYIGLVTTVNCSATVAKAIADRFPSVLFEEDPHCDGVVAITHGSGCGMAPKGDGADILKRTIAGYARHANFAGVLVIGLGCEVNQIDRLFADMGMETGTRLRHMTIQAEGGTRAAIDKGKAIVSEMIELARAQDRRETCPASKLTLGLQCGGSDGWSGVTANPALGRASDLLVAAGGTVILSETPEIYGAEQLLYARARNENVRTALQARLEWWMDYTHRHGAEMNNNPSPGNIMGGLTTILEKSLGAVAKSGTSTLNGVFLYGEPITERGLVFMDSPGYDPCSATGQTASGATVLAFTTGRGSVFGSKPAPCIKLASNARLAAHMAEDMDVDCSPVLEGVSLDELGATIFRKILAVASGEQSASEELGVGDLEFVPWQIGAVM